MSRPSFAALFNAALSRAPETPPDAGLAQAEDSDEWMYVDANDLDEVLERAMHTSGSAMETDGGDVEDRVTKKKPDKPHDLAAKVKQFVEGKGDVEGARFEDVPFSNEDSTNSNAEEDLLSDDSSSDADDEESNAETQRRDALARG